LHVRSIAVSDGYGRERRRYFQQAAFVYGRVLTMGRRQLLLVTHYDENITVGVSYAIELAKSMDEDIMILLVQKRINLNGKFENLMTASTFGEAGE
jgi:hypothetical protein